MVVEVLFFNSFVILGGSRKMQHGEVVASDVTSVGAVQTMHPHVHRNIKCLLATTAVHCTAGYMVTSHSFEQLAQLEVR